MSSHSAGAARLPPPSLPGLDPGWSRLVEVPSGESASHRWHVLDNQVADARLTLLCVHGNPSWSFLWRNVIAQAPQGVRVIAADHLDMGFSERTGTFRRLSQRVDDLCALTEQLAIESPVVTVAHDWGGPISLGWALRNRERLAGIVLTNTAVHQPAGSPAPTIIRFVRQPSLLRRICVETTAFVRGSYEMCRPRLEREIREAYLAPYLTADRREAVANFVEDIPLEPSHESAGALDAIADGLSSVDTIPALLLWGPSDPVFSDLYLQDLRARLPHADVHRFVGASHFVSEQADVAGAIHRWVDGLTTDGLTTENSLDGSDASGTGSTAPTTRARLWEPALNHPEPDAPAVIEFTGDETMSVSWAELRELVESTARGLRALGFEAGDRVALLVPPGIDLTVAIYACWRIGTIAVLVDGGLGPRGINRAMQGADPDHIIGIPRALAAARALGWRGTKVMVDAPADPTPAPATRALRVTARLRDLATTDDAAPLPSPPASSEQAAVVFTSGSTGPSKGVRYRHSQIEAQRDVLMSTYSIGPSDRLVAAFAPFALYGPAMGIASIVPVMDVTAPRSLSAAALGDAAVAIEATMVFASPAALVNVSATSNSLTPEHRAAFENVRLTLSAGAPVSKEVLENAATLMPNASVHTPYGMTEVLPVADISLDDLRAIGPGNGVCVGRPVAAASVMISPLDASGAATGDSSTEPYRTGEVTVLAEHGKDGYDKLWATERDTHLGPRHRTGDVGHFDDRGRLWIEGRMSHVITTNTGPVTPVGLEQASERLASVRQAAAVGVGPPGKQVVAIVVVPQAGARSGLAPTVLADDVRTAIGNAFSTSAPDIASVLAVASLPVDRRHNAKVDRTAVAVAVDGYLAGRTTRLSL